MTKFKNIRIKMKGGKTRTQRVMVLASGKYRFVKNIGSRVKKSTKRSKKNNPKRRTRRMGKRKRRGGSRKFTIPLAPVIGLAVGLAQPAQFIMTGQVDNAVKQLSINYLGYDPDAGAFWAQNLMKGLVPLALGLMIHKFVGGAPLNANRMLAAANVPIIRI